MKARVFVTLKSGVLDPQGQAVAKTLGRLGYEEVAGVRIGKYVEMEIAGEASRERIEERIEEMCRRLIANTVIEDFRIEVDEGSGTGTGTTTSTGKKGKKR